MPVHHTVRGLCIGIGVAAGLLVAACGSQGGRPPGGMTPQVAVVTLKPQAVTLTRELPGRVSAFLVAEVRPQVSGIVKRRLFTEGGSVRAGEPLYEIDDAIYRAQFNSARATLQKAQATLEAAKTTARRAAEMVKIDAISAQDNDNAIAALGQAEADVASAQAAVDSAAVNLAVRPHRLAHQRAHRQVQRDAGRAGYQLIRPRRWRPCSSSIRYTWTSTSRAASGCS